TLKYALSRKSLRSVQPNPSVERIAPHAAKNCVRWSVSVCVFTSGVGNMPDGCGQPKTRKSTLLTPSLNLPAGFLVVIGISVLPHCHTDVPRGQLCIFLITETA